MVLIVFNAERNTVIQVLCDEQGHFDASAEQAIVLGRF